MDFIVNIFSKHQYCKLILKHINQHNIDVLLDMIAEKK